MKPQEPLAPRDLLILAVLAEGALHGYGIIKAVETRSEAEVLLDPANLYRVLRRMRRSGWIEELEAADDEGGRRRTYVLSPGGRSVLRSEVERLEGLLARVHAALAPSGGRAGV